VELDEVKLASGGETPGHRPGPGLEAGKPAEHAVRGEDDVEALAAEQHRRVVDVSLDEAGGDGQLGGQRPRLGDGHLGEIHAGHPRPEPRPAERVLAEVALEVEE
jgi:hypothetical protein